MSTKLLKAIACILSCSSASGQFFADFHAHGTLACRFPRSALVELSPYPAVGVGWGARLRRSTVLSLDVLLVGGRFRQGTHEELLFWAELQYRLLLHMRYSRHPTVTPTVSIEWIFPFGLSAAEGIRTALHADFGSLRFGVFAGASIPLPSWGRFFHVLAGGQWMLRSPLALRSAFMPELRLVWESL